MKRNIKITLGQLPNAQYTSQSANAILQTAPVQTQTVDDQGLGVVVICEALEIEIAKAILRAIGMPGWPTSASDFDYQCDVQKKNAFRSVAYDGVQYFGKVEW